MIKRLITILIAVVSLISTSAQTSVGNWKVYSMFSTIKKMVQTPDKVYFISGNNLYSFDKNTQETYNYTTKNKLNDIVVNNIYYNKYNDYLVVTYSTGNIDLIYDDGTVINLPDIKDSGLNYSLEINDVAFNGDDIYVATKFGLVVFNEKRQEVKYSGVYDKEISTVTCVGDYVIVDQEHNLYYLHKDKRFETFDNYIKLPDNFWIEDMEGLDNNKLLIRATGKIVYYLDINFEKNTYSRVSIDNSQKSSNLIYGKDAYYYITNGVLYSVSLDGEKLTHSNLPSEISSHTISIWDNADEVWAANANGIGNYNISGGTLTTIKSNFKPESLSVDNPFFITSDSKGKVYVSNHGESKYFDFPGTWWSSYISTIDNNGKVEDISPIGLEITHTGGNPAQYTQNGRLYDSFQLVIDPEDDETYYIGTYWEGIYKVKNGKMLAHYHPATSSLLESWGCRVFAMAFDKDNNLWCVNEVSNRPGSPALHILPAEARKKDSTTPEDWVSVNLGDFLCARDGRIFICEKSNMIFMCDGTWSGYIVAYDTKGTYSDTSDDEYHLWSSFIDQDGKIFDPDQVSAFAEDEQGRVWIGTSLGVIEIANPQEALNPGMKVRRLKISNNGIEEGYLLDGIHVTSISVGKNNRKWLGTMTNGVYLVNEDGNQILENYTSDNSYYPGGATYNVYVHPITGSVFMGTVNGLVEYNDSYSPASENYESVYSYPNPVKPDYTGWITVNGLMDNSYVSILDINGDVLYSARSQGGIMAWDGCDIKGKRVKAGVYQVKASQTENNADAPVVTKIVVVD